MSNETLAAANSLRQSFADSPRSLSAFEELDSILTRNPGVFRTVSEDTPDAVSDVAALANDLHRDIMRGQDFDDRKAPDEKDMVWLTSGDHMYLIELGFVIDKSKSGRLGAIIAMHPRREEIAALIPHDFIEKNDSMKVMPHVARLLSHTNAPECEEFAMEILKHPEAFTAIPESKDGTGSFIFWTYGPYLLNAMKNRGMSFDDFMDKWTNKRKSGQYRGNAKYPGIEEMYEDSYSRMHFLTKDGKDPSHVFAEYIAEKVIMPALS